MLYLSFPICSLLIVSLIAIIFFSRKSIVTDETRIYKILLIINLIESFFALFGLIFMKFFPESLYLSQNRLYNDYVLERIFIVLYITNDGFK